MHHASLLNIGNGIDDFVTKPIGFWGNLRKVVHDGFKPH